MSALNELINKFCPHGVESYVLGELERKNILKLGRGNVISKVEIKNTPGDFPVYSSSVIGDGEIGRYGKYMFDDERITWSIDGGGNFFYRNNLKYSVTNVGGWIKVLDSTILNTKYLYYSLSSSWKNQKYNYIKKAYPSVIRTEYDIPLPPLPVQEEIVKILDKFTDLENELENELRMRKMQFNAYRDKLLTFDNGVKIEKLGDLTTIHRGKGDAVIIVNTGSIGEIKYCKNNFWCSDGCFWLKSNDKLNNKFIYYYIKQFDVYFQSQKRPGGVPTIDREIVETLKIPVPPIEKQKEIVEKLDKFNDMCNEISDGLPLEIELRKKQKKYILNKLLNI